MANLTKKCQQRLKKLGISADESLTVCSLVEDEKQLDLCLLAAEHLPKDSEGMREAKKMILGMEAHKTKIEYYGARLSVALTPREEKIVREFKKRVIIAKNVEELKQAFINPALGTPRLIYLYPYSFYQSAPNRVALFVALRMYKTVYIEMDISSEIDIQTFLNNPGSKIIQEVFLK